MSLNDPSLWTPEALDRLYADIQAYDAATSSQPVGPPLAAAPSEPLSCQERRVPAERVVGEVPPPDRDHGIVKFPRPWPPPPVRPNTLPDPSDHPSHGPHLHEAPDHRKHDAERLRHNREWLHGRDSLNAAPRRIRHVRRIQPTVGASIFLFWAGVAFGAWLCWTIGQAARP